MEDLLKRRENETEFEQHKRLVFGKLVDKTLVDEDYTELSKYVYGKELSSDVCRREMYGSKYTLELLEKDKNNTEIENREEDSFKYNYKETIELNKDGSQTSDKLIKMSKENCKDANYLLKAHSYDPKAFELISAKNNIWNAYSKQDGIMELYSSKITIKPRTEYMWNEEDIVKIFNNIKLDNKYKSKVNPIKINNNGKLLVLPIADFHYGLVSDKYSNGNDYDLEIAEQLFFDVINDVVESNKAKTFEKVLFVVGNDATNSDNLSGTTAKGTPQDECALWFTVVDRITRLFVKGINILREELKLPIDITYVPSNHDLHTMFGVMQTINAYYKDDNNITVDTSPLPRKYYKFGKNVLAFSHDVKVKEALKIVSTEAKDMWSDSNRTIYMLAHLHQSMVYEKQGMLELLRLPTISGYSRWTNGQGYVQTERKNQAFIIDFHKGIIDTHNTILDI
jgi:hypothetical protein